jgi:hypothetical protein
MLSCPLCGATWFSLHCASSYIYLGFTHITLLFVILNFMMFLFPSFTSRIVTSIFINNVSNLPFVPHAHTYSVYCPLPFSSVIFLPFDIVSSYIYILRRRPMCNLPLLIYFSPFTALLS